MWLFTGIAAYIIAIINLILVIVGKHKYCGMLVFLSLSCGLMAMVSEYGLVNRWVQAGDMAALLDVVPTMTTVLFIAVGVGILLNAAAVILSLKKQT